MTLLREFGYHRRADLPLIIRAAGAPGSAAARSALRSSVTDRGVVVDRELPAVNGVASRVGTGRLGALWQGLTGGSASTQLLRGQASKVWLDGLRRPSLHKSVSQIGAPAAWQAGLDGTGVTVAVLDTGIDDSHKDLAGKVTAHKNFIGGPEDDKDQVGHGTHVASTIAGSAARMSLSRDGEKVFEDLEGRAVGVQVPAQRSRYEFSITGNRAAPVRLSTQVTAKWTFTSGHVDGDALLKLPISIVRFAPTLSLRGTAKVGTTLSIPVTVQKQEGSAAANNRSLSVQVSFNGGRTWANLPVRVVNGSSVVQVKNPRVAGFVSLRATAKDTAGNTAYVSILRAYEVTR